MWFRVNEIKWFKLFVIIKSKKIESDCWWFSIVLWRKRGFCCISILNIECNVILYYFVFLFFVKFIIENVNIWKLVVKLLFEMKSLVLFL